MVRLTCSGIEAKVVVKFAVAYWVPRKMNEEHKPSGDHGTARIPSIRSAPHLSDSGILLTFADRVLVASPCSVTTTASDDEFSIPTNTPG